MHPSLLTFVSHLEVEVGEIGVQSDGEAWWRDQASPVLLSAVRLRGLISNEDR